MKVCVFTADKFFYERHPININSQRRPFCEYEDEKISVSVCTAPVTLHPHVAIFSSVPTLS